MTTSIMTKFNDEIMAMAFEKVDKEALSLVLSKKIAKNMADDMEAVLEDDLCMSDWIADELTNSRTKAGKAYQAAMKAIALRMATNLAGDQ